MQEIKYAKKKQENKQLLFLFHKLLEFEETWWSQLFRFQNSQLFKSFNTRYSVTNILQIRLDDIIYMILLGALCLTFGFIPLDSSNPLTTAFHQSLIFFYITTFLQLISSHWYRWIVLFSFCVIYPALIFLTFQGYITIISIDTSQSILSYIGYLTLIIIFVLHILIYPIKEYIRNNVGAIYSYLYGLSITVVLYLWPLYSFILSVTNSGSINLDFITQNQPLLVFFLTVVVTGFYFYTHNTIFQTKRQTIQEILTQQFTEGQLTRAIQQNEINNSAEQSCIYSYFNIYVRFMSFIIYLTTLGLQIFLFFILINNLTQIATICAIMSYIVAFLLLGTFINNIPISKQYIIPIITILSLLPAVASRMYYSTTVNFYNYMFLSVGCPIWAFFWSFIKSISIKRPIFKINSLVCLYLFMYIPLITFVINTYGYFSSNSQIQSNITYFLYSAISLSLLVSLIIFIVWQVIKCKTSQEQQKKQRIPVDYNYFEQGNPEYIYYQISKKFTLNYLIGIDLRDIGYLFNTIFLFISQLSSLHAINQLNTTFSTTIYYSSAINEIIYAQIPICLLFYLYAQIFIASSISSYYKYIFSIIFIIFGTTSLTTAFIFSVLSTSFKLFGFFSLILALISAALQNIKQNTINIFNFIASIIIISFWLFIILPFIIFIPFGSIYVNQNEIGSYIYGSLLGSLILIIVIVGILTLIFNLLIDKYEEEKKFKFVMEDVKTLFNEEGVQAADEQLHILYESFLFRDKKYVYFLKRGYPLNLLKDTEDNVTKLVTSEDYQLKRIPTNKVLKEQEKKQKSLLWRCLTFCCGQDQEEINTKIKKAKNVIDSQQLQSLIPKNLILNVLNSLQKNKTVKKNRKLGDPNKTYSSKSLVLKNLHEGARYLGDEYILLKTNKNVDLAIEIWHNIFDFISNKDEVEPLIILNDFRLFASSSKIKLSESEIDQTFFDFSESKWKDLTALNLNSFSLAVEKLSQLIYQDQQIDQQQKKYVFLINKIYYNLSLYEEFTTFLSDKKHKNRISKEEITHSPFKTSYKRFQEFKFNREDIKMRLFEKQIKHNRNKLQDPKKQIKTQKKEIQVKETQISCKKKIYQSIRKCQNCCKKQDSHEQIERKLFVRPWKLICVDAVKIIQKKEIDWSSNQSQKQHNFRPIFNNIMIAAFKLLDIYSYINVSLSNPQIGWISGMNSSNLYLSYNVQSFIAYGVTLICVPFGVKGIMLIFEDRLGLTQNRLPATFPHPMFFFTTVYKLVILSLFNIISQTFLVSFNCNWSTNSPPFTLYDDTSVECFSDSHNRFAAISILALLAYYPLSSYAMPNFQFSQKSLDLKYRPSYLILYFQINFILLVGKVLISNSTDTSLQIGVNSINISALTMLLISVIWTNPCLIGWFNSIQFLVVWIGVVVNTMGLVLYITQLWTICVIVTFSVCGLSCVLVIIYIKRKYFSQQVHDAKEEDNDNVKELEEMWKAKQYQRKKLISFDHARQRNDLKEQNFNGFKIQKISDDGIAQN